MSETADDDGPKTFVFKLSFEKPPEFTISYNNKEDLFHSFKDEVDKWRSVHGTTFWVDSNGDQVKIDDADALQRIATEATDTVKVIVREEGGDSDSDPDYTLTVEKRKKKKVRKTDHGRDRFHGEKHHHCSRCNARSHSNDLSDEEDFEEFCSYCRLHCGGFPFVPPPPYILPPICCRCYPSHVPVDTRSGIYPYFEMGRSRGGYHHRGGMRGNFHGY